MAGKSRSLALLRIKEKPLPQQELSESKALLGWCGGCCTADLCVLAAEALDAASRIHQLLLASEERVAVGTDFNVNVTAMSGARGEDVSTGAVHPDFAVRRMNGCFHGPRPFRMNLYSIELFDAAQSERIRHVERSFLLPF
jgi:hypothetical protein